MACLSDFTQVPILADDVKIDIDCKEKDENGETQDLHERTGVSSRRSISTVAILSCIYMVITMAPFTVVGAMPYLKAAFKMDDNGSIFITLAFAVSNVVFGLLFGHLGDIWSRKRIACTGMAVWSAIRIGMIFVPNEYFPVFLFINALLGAAQASFRITAPSIIADLYVGDRRSRALYCYYVAGFIGSGLGYIIGSEVTRAFSGDWRIAFLISPVLGMIGLLFMCVIVKEPTRGAAEGNNGKPLSPRAWISDVKNLVKNRSFMFCTLGMTAVKFAAGAISSYGPIFLHRAQGIIEESAQNQTEVSRDYDSLIFGLISCISGSLGVVTGVKIAKIYRKNNPRADPIVCASGLFGCAVFLVLALFMGDISIVATYVFMSIGIMCLNLNCSVSADIRQYVVSPARRSTAQAIFMIVSEPGTAGSSYVIKLISNAIKSHNPDSPFWEIHSLQYALLMVCPVVVAIGGGFFFACACFIEKDRKTAVTESEDWLLKEVIVETP